MNRFIRTVVVAPMTTKGTTYPTRIPCKFQGKRGQVVLDQIRTVDKTRLVRRLGKIDKQTQENVLTILGEMFAP
jgi:mRNA interferase MazF